MALNEMGQEVVGQNAGFGAVPNSSLALIDLKREQDRTSMTDKIRADERAVMAAANVKDAETARQIELARAQGFDEASSSFGINDTPVKGQSGNQDINGYLASGLESGTLAPEEAMAALKEPSVDPEIKRILANSLGLGYQEATHQSAPQQQSGLGSVPQKGFVR
jgi:hypothetical protein